MRDRLNQVQAVAGMTGKSMKPVIFWLEGVLTFFNVPFPHDRDDPRRLGFNVGQQIVGLYLTEMLLKYALDHSGASHGQHHNLHELFQEHLPSAPPCGGATVRKDSE